VPVSNCLAILSTLRREWKGKTTDASVSSLVYVVCHPASCSHALLSNFLPTINSTGVKSKIQVSESTYKLLVEAGKEGWLKERPDKVKAKGKGVLKTWFLYPHVNRRAASVVSGTSNSAQDAPQSEAFQSAQLTEKSEKEVLAGPDGADAVANKAARQLCNKEERLVTWITQLLKEHISKLVAMRDAVQPRPENPTYKPTEGQTSLDEVAEIIELPKFDEKAFAASKNFQSVKISDAVVKQLNEYVGTIALMYHSDNPFHNCKPLSVDVAECCFIHDSHTDSRAFACFPLSNHFPVEHAWYVYSFLLLCPCRRCQRLNPRRFLSSFLCTTATLPWLLTNS